MPTWQFLENAVQKAKNSLLNLSIEEAISLALNYGKEDTLMLDAVPERALAEEIKKAYPEAALVSEEESFGDPAKAKMVFFADPLDGSSMLEKFLSKQDNKKMCVGRALFEDACVPSRIWESEFGKPVDLTSCCTALTAVMNGKLLHAALYNYCTGETFLFDETGFCSHGRLRSTIKFPADFRGLIAVRQHEGATYCGKDAYKENLQRIDLPVEARIVEKYSQHTTGPMRPLFLSDLFRGYEDPRMLGFVLANGEKITEWIHWFLMFPKYTGLKLFEVIDKNCGEIRGVPTAVRDASESIFQESVDGFRLNLSKLMSLKNPAEYRSTLVICDSSNKVICDWAAANGHRNVWFYE